MSLWKSLKMGTLSRALSGALVGFGLSACHSRSGAVSCDEAEVPLVAVPVAVTGGKCDNGPRVLLEIADLLPVCAADAIRTPLVMAADATHLYFQLLWDPVTPGEVSHLEAFRGFLMRAPLTGGRVERLAPLPSGSPRTPQSLALTSEYAVYIQAAAVEKGEGAGVARVPLGGGPVTVLAEAAGQATSVIVDERFVYFADESGAKRVPLEGGDVQVLASGFIPVALGILEGTLYLATEDKIYSIAADGGDLSTVSSVGGMLLSSCGDAMCWISGPALQQSLVRFAPGGVPVTLVDGLYEVHSLVFDGASFFLTEGMGGIARVSADGPSTGGYEALGIFLAVNDSCLFWSGPDTITAISRSVADIL